MKPVELVIMLRERDEWYARTLPGLPRQRRTVLLRVREPLGWEPARPFPPTLRVPRLTTGRVLGRLKEGMLLVEFVLDELLDVALERAAEDADALALGGEPDDIEAYDSPTLRILRGRWPPR
jgi:hypothetical protein